MVEVMDDGIDVVMVAMRIGGTYYPTRQLSNRLLIGSATLGGSEERREHFVIVHVLS